MTANQIAAATTTMITKATRPRMRQHSKLGSYQQPLGYIFEGGRVADDSVPEVASVPQRAAASRADDRYSPSCALERCPLATRSRMRIAGTACARLSRAGLSGSRICPTVHRMNANPPAAFSESMRGYLRVVSRVFHVEQIVNKSLPTVLPISNRGKRC